MTTLKKTTLIVGLLLGGLLLKAPAANAFDDVSCFARLEQPDGKVKKQIVERQAMVFLSWNKLAVAFQAPYFNGQDPVVGSIALMDYKTKKVIASWSPTLEGRWEFSAKAKTPYGRVTIDCD